jgi:hypothetical protein
MITITNHEEAFEKIVSLIKARVGQDVLLISDDNARQMFRIRIEGSCSPSVFHFQKANIATHREVLDHLLGKTNGIVGGVYWAETSAVREATGLSMEMRTRFLKLPLVKIVCAAASMGENLTSFGNLSEPEVIIVRLGATRKAMPTG